MPHLSYATSKKGTNISTKQTIDTKNMVESYEKSIDNNNTNMCQLQKFEIFSILYSVDYPADSNFWNSKAHSISIFDTNIFTEINTKNTTTSLHRITFFIKNRNFYSKTEKDILDILGFEQIA